MQRIAIAGARGLLNPVVNKMRRVSAASVDSQFPVDPRYAGPLAGRLAPLLAIPRRSPLRGAPRREARAATRNSPSIPTLRVGPPRRVARAARYEAARARR